MRSMIIYTFVASMTVTAYAYAYDDAASKAQATEFVTTAAMANMFEIEAAKIEIEKGKAREVVAFAQDMLEDHLKAQRSLATSAMTDGVTFPRMLDAEHDKKVDALKHSDAPNLDQAYLSTQVTAHEEAVELFTNYTKTGPSGAVKNTAAKILPDLRMHLNRVEGLTSE